jgi:hypothetical protein
MEDWDGLVCGDGVGCWRLGSTEDGAGVESVEVETMLVALMAVESAEVEIVAETPSSTVTVTNAISVTISTLVVRARRWARAWPWIPKLAAKSGITTEIKEIRSEARMLGDTFSISGLLTSVSGCA